MAAASPVFVHSFPSPEISFSISALPIVFTLDAIATASPKAPKVLPRVLILLSVSNFSCKALITPGAIGVRSVRSSNSPILLVALSRVSIVELRKVNISVKDFKPDKKADAASTSSPCSNFVLVLPEYLVTSAKPLTIVPDAAKSPPAKY